jgi:hypothetical protein
VVQACLYLGQQGNHGVQDFHLPFLKGARLACESVPFDKSANELEVVCRLAERGNLPLSQVLVVCQSVRDEPALLTSVGSAEPLPIKGGLAQIVNPVAKGLAIGGEQLGGNPCHLTVCFFPHLCYRFCSPRRRIGNLLPSVQNRPDGDDKPQDTHGQADDARHVAKRTFAEGEAEDTSSTQD